MEQARRHNLGHQRGFVPHWQMMGMIFIAGLGIIAAIAYPRFVDHVAKEKIYEILDASRPVTEKLDAHMTKHGALPDDLAKAGVTGLPRHVTAMRIGTSPAELVLTMDFYPLEGKSLILVQDRQPPDSVWRCTSKDIPEKRLPQSCRK